jgi:hypothetical protein
MEFVFPDEIAERVEEILDLDMRYGAKDQIVETQKHEFYITDDKGEYSIMLEFLKDGIVAVNFDGDESLIGKFIGPLCLGIKKANGEFILDVPDEKTKGFTHSAFVTVRGYDYARPLDGEYFITGIGKVLMNLVEEQYEQFKKEWAQEKLERKGRLLPAKKDDTKDPDDEINNLAGYGFGGCD